MRGRSAACSPQFAVGGVRTTARTFLRPKRAYSWMGLRFAAFSRPAMPRISIGWRASNPICSALVFCTMQPDMPLGQWLLVTLTAGVGGSLLSIGSAAGVALVGQARGIYTFAAHMRWTPAIAAGYAASIVAHLTLNRALF